MAKTVHIWGAGGMLTQKILKCRPFESAFEANSEANITTQIHVV